MAQFLTAIEIARPVSEVFDFLARPANLVQLAPSEMRLELVQGPERLHLGAVMHWKARRLGARTGGKRAHPPFCRKSSRLGLANARRSPAGPRSRVTIGLPPAGVRRAHPR